MPVSGELNVNRGGTAGEPHATTKSRLNTINSIIWDARTVANPRAPREKENHHSARSARPRHASACDGHPARRLSARIDPAARGRVDGSIRREPHGAARSA